MSFSKQLIHFTLIVFAIFLLSACLEDEWKPREALEINEGESVEDYLLREKLKGSALIIDDANIVLQQGFDYAARKNKQENNPDTVFRLASVTKQFTAMAIMILQEQGRLNVDQPVSDFVPEFPNGDIILIRHLLTHTSGLIRDYEKPTPDGDVTPERLISLFKDAPLQSNPGEEYSYSNSGYKLLGYIIEIASGISYQDFVQQQIFVPLGMSRSKFGLNEMDEDNNAQGYMPDGKRVKTQNVSLAYSGGGLVSTINDLYLWDQSFYNNSLISQESKELIYTPYLNEYGFGWKIRQVNGELTYSHGGALPGFSTFIMRVPNRNRVIILLSNEHFAPVKGMAENIMKLLD